MSGSTANTHSAFEGPDYTSYSQEELEDVLQHIDKRYFPERYAEAQAALASKKAASTKGEEQQTGINEHKQNSNLASHQLDKPKWSERHAIARCSDILLIVLFLGLMSPLFGDFSAAKAWVDNSALAICLLSLLVGWLWFVSISVDEPFRVKLNEDVRGKIAIVTMPFLGIILSWNMVDNVLPYALHAVSTSSASEHNVTYSKGSASKRCQYKLLLKDTETHSHDRLCVTQGVYNRLPQKGTAVLKGQESTFGFTMESYRFR